MNIPDEVIEAVVAEMGRHHLTDSKNLGYYRTESVCACGESWMSGDHDGDPDFYEQMYRHGALAVAPLVAVWARREALLKAAELADRVAKVNGHMLFSTTETVPDALVADVAVRLRFLAEGDTE
jgi:phosphoenolpyruvate carboxylase